MRAAGHRLAVAAVALACTITATAAARPAPGELPAADKRTLAELALQWAVDGGLADFTRVKDPAKLLVSTANLGPKMVLKLPGRSVSILSPARLQAQADNSGDFLYFRFGPFRRDQQGTRVTLSLAWAVSTHSSTLYLSGAGATLHFEKHAGKWRLLPVTDRWMS